MKQIKFYLIAIALIVIVVSCKKKSAGTAPEVTTGVFELNQGDYGSNNSSLTYYDFGTSIATPFYFEAVNGFGFGDTGDDAIIYGGKMYIVVNGSGYVRVANALTAQSIDSISFLNAGVNRSPQNIVAYKNKVFVSSFDGTVAVIDTTSLTIGQFITVGLNPAQMAIFGTNLYVSNSGGITPGYDSTVSVIDLNTYTQTNQITVGTNPGSIAVDNSGNLYVSCTGNYGAIGSFLVKVAAGTNVITKSADTVGTVRYYNNNLYVTGGYGGIAKIRVLSTADLSVVKSNFVSDGTSMVAPYGLDIDNTTGNVYVGDAVATGDGEVYCFDTNGNKKFSFATQSSYPIKTLLIQQQ
jgi:YVTN family beta-propeller protein